MKARGLNDAVQIDRLSRAEAILGKDSGREPQRGRESVCIRAHHRTRRCERCKEVLKLLLPLQLVRVAPRLLLLPPPRAPLVAATLQHRRHLRTRQWHSGRLARPETRRREGVPSLSCARARAMRLVRR
eukprot:2628068-Pleurochrysis_carterae.AAC.2